MTQIVHFIINENENENNNNNNNCVYASVDNDC